MQPEGHRLIARRASGGWLLEKMPSGDRLRMIWNWGARRASARR